MRKLTWVMAVMAACGVSYVSGCAKPADNAAPAPSTTDPAAMNEMMNSGSSTTGGGAEVPAVETPAEAAPAEAAPAEAAPAAAAPAEPDPAAKQPE
jgi:hypothetical protein